MLLSQARALFLDEISTGLDAATTFDIVSALRDWTRTVNGSATISLLQPTPETFHLFDKIILMREGQIVFTGSHAELQQHLFALRIEPNSEMDLADWLVDFLADPARIWKRDIQDKGRRDSFFASQPSMAEMETYGLAAASSIVHSTTTQLGAGAGAGGGGGGGAGPGGRGAAAGDNLNKLASVTLRPHESGLERERETDASHLAPPTMQQQQQQPQRQQQQQPPQRAAAFSTASTAVASTRSSGALSVSVELAALKLPGTQCVGPCDSRSVAQAVRAVATGTPDPEPTLTPGTPQEVAFHLGGDGAGDDDDEDPDAKEIIVVVGGRSNVLGPLFDGHDEKEADKMLQLQLPASSEPSPDIDNAATTVSPLPLSVLAPDPSPDSAVAVAAALPVRMEARERRRERLKALGQIVSSRGIPLTTLALRRAFERSPPFNTISEDIALAKIAAATSNKNKHQSAAEPSEYTRTQFYQHQSHSNLCHLRSCLWRQSLFLARNPRIVYSRVIVSAVLGAVMATLYNMLGRDDFAAKIGFINISCLVMVSNPHAPAYEHKSQQHASER